MQPIAMDKVYDIILLDYLFSHEAANGQHYGTKLLDDIKSSQTHNGLGVLQSYWIYPITVFNEAIQSHLQAKGYQYLEQYWQLTRGADPLNTPHLFRRTLLEFMEAQAQKIQFSEEDIWHFLAQNAKHLLKNMKVNNVAQYDGQMKTRSEDDDMEGLVLDTFGAKLIYGQFIQKFSKVEGLPENSALAQTVRSQMQQQGVKELKEHLGTLLYLLGFSTGFDFKVIVDEFRFVESGFEQFRKKNGARENLEKGMKYLALSVFSIHGKYF